MDEKKEAYEDSTIKKASQTTKTLRTKLQHTNHRRSETIHSKQTKRKRTQRKLSGGIRYCLQSSETNME